MSSNMFFIPREEISEEEVLQIWLGRVYAPPEQRKKLFEKEIVNEKIFIYNLLFRLCFPKSNLIMCIYFAKFVQIFFNHQCKFIRKLSIFLLNSSQF